MPAYPPTRPHGPQNPTRIAAASPLAVTGILLETLRERFRQDQNLLWFWDPDPSVGTILIETSYNDAVEQRNASIAIYVTRLNTTPQQLLVGDRTDVNLPDHKEFFTGLMTSSYSVDCVANDQGASVQLADIVQHFFIASRQILTGMFGLQNMTHASMGQSAPFEQEQGKFSTPVSFEVSYHTQWSTVKIRPLLQSVGVRVIDSRTGMDAAEAFADSAAQSYGRTWPIDPPEPLSGPYSSAPHVPPPEAPVPGAVTFPASAFFLPNQRLLGVRDTVNRVFSTQIPFIHTDTISEIVYRNGIRVDPSAYTVTSPQTVEFAIPPEPDDLLLLDGYVAR